MPLAAVPAAPDLAAAFTAAMAALGPFGPEPHLAVATSGGADSLALCLLAHAWATDRGGRVTALTVDHQLRAESAQEATQVGRWLAGRGIDQRILPWLGPKPATGIQSAARAARYRLLCGACGEIGVLHLLVAHHARDQAETVLMRAINGSGIEGVAAMQRLVTAPQCRILRPLLTFDPVWLRQFLAAADQPWIEDPSNRSAEFSRVRIRQALPSLATAGLDAAALARFAATMQEARNATEEATVGWLAAAVTVHDAGYAETDVAFLRAAPRFVAVRAMSRLIAAIGGDRWEPRPAAVERLVARLVAGTAEGGATLGRCRLVVRGTGVVICREPRNLPPPQLVVPGNPIYWDGRFRITTEACESTAPRPLRLEALGPRSLPTAASDEKATEMRAAVPKAVWPTLPALSDDRGVTQAPHLGYTRESSPTYARITRVVFLSRRSLSDRDSFIV